MKAIRNKYLAQLLHVQATVAIDRMEAEVKCAVNKAQQKLND